MAASGEQPDSAPKPRAQDFAAVRDWPGYFQVMAGKPGRETLMAALARFEEEGQEPGFAIDLGCGEGRDTLELLNRGWRVLAMDGHPEGFEHLLPRVTAELRGRLDTRVCEFRDVELPSCDLLNCSFSLPFCEPADFPGLWEKILAAVRPGGRFAGQFFGERDTWASLPDRTHHTRAEVERLLSAFDVEMLDVEERQEQPPTPNPKYWQVFHVVARKR